MPAKGISNRNAHVVTGPGVDGRPVDGAGAALSLAITYAQRHARANGEPCTFYVRDPAGETVGRVEAETNGVARILGARAIQRERDAPFTPGA